MANSRLEVLKQVAHALAVHFGESCEVVIHDLRQGSDHSIVYIENGELTGRKVGDAPSQVVLDAIRNSQRIQSDQLAYLTKTDNGRIFKSSTIYIRDDADNLNYILGINYDITTLLALESSLHSLTSCPGEAASDSDAAPRRITTDVSQLLDQLIQQAVDLVGTPALLMNKEEKIRAINYLNDAGAFLITKSGDKVAKYFGISKYTLYSYVDINK